MEIEMNTEIKPVRRKRKIRRPNGRPLMYPDKTIVRMPKGSLKRVNQALREDEYQGDFMRVAVEKELKARRV